MGDGGPLHTEGNALLKAVFHGKIRLARLLLEGGAYINEGNERGETPIVAACLAVYEDSQTRQKMVRYLLEKGADPNIPDKSGRTALMHACAEQAGKDVVSLLLENGADPSIKDYSGSSALVYAINKGDRDTLQILLDACKAKGKEVIIITTDTSPSGTKKTKQYLNSPPSPGIVDKLSPVSCMSPSEVEIRTSGSPRGEEEEEGIFSFALTSALPLPSTRPPGEKRPPPRKLLKRLNSEPWGLVAPSVLGGTNQEKKEVEVPKEERLVTELNGMSISGPSRPLLSRRHSIETHDPCSPKLIDRSCSEDCAALCGPSWADKVQQHQILYRRNTAPESQETASQAHVTLRCPAHPKLTRMDHYESDTHLCPESIPGSPDSGRVSVERRKYNASPLSLLTSSSRESLESIPNSVSPITMRRRTPGLLERRGSGTLLLDHISHTRPGFLPPLNVNPQRPIPDIRANGKPPSPIHSSNKILLPMAPSSPKRVHDFKVKKKLMRRHSMQTEQMKQLSNFQEILAEKVIEFNGD
ncbi:ankyrin repeat domain-containing protein 34A [Denticeps clupeoides]|uniref:Ankyrin repeat domain-containing protein 34A n=1 Tax=Denticeps clupeoides TaxID=299321 RepID=A0AAY4DZ26_9TELE|nr:ankyrin repeat domain-containing protein 34A [Denticeps clupeoides]XP_028837587.1 ankyrin repeat domain-containing protein 34A [Denticeps clupeoides]XP_028837588.1 ankyrin repeat domain-containing protein 34A [Denticeps clupeoides]XP_028837589.1 ankyrin repeat domain-containing protein 34A [Denticeps clupeoides]XP_028837590.1 ankyrin repeat domain-containing protein 34A [Denticeps clupeoides]XP_028837591.1 ankyrin repeat domain-containing protein 34A [Denticeps clupeoides]